MYCMEILYLCALDVIAREGEKSISRMVLDTALAFVVFLLVSYLFKASL